MAGLLLAGSCLFAVPRISIGVGVGVPAGGYYGAAPVYAAPDYVAPAYVPPPAPVVALGRLARGAYFGARARFRR